MCESHIYPTGAVCRGMGPAWIDRRGSASVGRIDSGTPGCGRCDGRDRRITEIAFRTAVMAARQEQLCPSLLCLHCARGSVLPLGNLYARAKRKSDCGGQSILQETRSAD